MKRLSLIFFLLLSCVVTKAQFSLSGEDPGGLRWMRMDTPGFRIIYPEGTDSLAVVYGSWLEKARTAVSWSSGMRIGEYHRGRLPVVLHASYPVSNASVTWAPKRMDIFTVPDPYSPTPVPWERLLSIHEGRHASQMQAGEGGNNKILSVLTGEMFAGAVAGIYPGPALLEGDAVVTETALSVSGRGRHASFLDYMAPALDCGDWRDYWRWSLGSDKLFTPDHYRAGYMLVSGMRVFFDRPLFVDEYFSGVRRGGLFVLRKTVKEASGMNVTKSFDRILREYQTIWAGEAETRGPFMPSAQVSIRPWRHVSYSGSVIDKDGNIWSKKSGLTVEGSLARISPSGKETRVRSFAAYTSPLSYDTSSGRIWWSEYVPDTRWTLGGASTIRYVETSAPSKVRSFTSKGRYYNPAPSPDGIRVAAVEYPMAGGSRIVVLKVSDGSVDSIMEAPDSMQITELAWVGDRLFAAGLSDRGMGVYEAGKTITPLLGPEPVELFSLRGAPPALAEGLSFVCDRTGTDEMYLIDIRTGDLRQVTSTRYGISSPVFNAAADTLFYSSLAPSDKPEAYSQGRMIYSTPTSYLPMTKVSFGDISRRVVADILSKQDKTLSGDSWDEAAEYSEASFSEPRRHRKLTPTLHSWAPVYFNIDNVETISGDDYYKSASLGATAMFQNLVGDGYGILGYGFHKDPDLDGDWRHSAHLKMAYNGLFPKIELASDIGDRAASDLQRIQVTDNDGKVAVSTAMTRISSRPYAEGSLKAYIPLNFSSGGISRGIVPQVKARFSNDRVNDRIIYRTAWNGNRDKIFKETGSLYQDNLSGQF
ncbi:MAG: hypothetical protein IJ840_09135, partial [Bacteroidales bacterium]|nr:hypothetical protein [Bacteroidales bacterium]